MNDNIIFYTKTRNGFLIFTYNGMTERYLYYSYKDALRNFREKHGLRYKHLKVIKDDEPITHGFMF